MDRPLNVTKRPEADPVTPAALPVQPSPFAVLRKRAFVYIWSAQLVSTIGDALTSLAAGIIVYRLTGSALSVGLMLMATAVPTLVFGLVAGVVVDRYDRKRIMIAADLLRAAVVFTIPFLVHIHIAWLYVAGHGRRPPSPSSSRRPTTRSCPRSRPRRSWGRRTRSWPSPSSARPPSASRWPGCSPRRSRSNRLLDRRRDLPLLGAA